MKKLFPALLCVALTSCGGAHDNLFPKSDDIGAVKIPGSVSFDVESGAYTLSGAGANIWASADEFFMVWREVTGDFSLSADVAFEGKGINAHRKMGLMIRDGSTPGAVYADIAIHGDGLTSLQYRPLAAGMTDEVVARSSGSSLPSRITLERHGEVIVMKLSVAPTEAGTPDQIATPTEAEITLPLPARCNVGLFVGSHDADVLETAHFSNVVFSELAE